MTCSRCGEQGHNKRGCPKKDQANPSQAQATSSARSCGPSQPNEATSQAQATGLSLSAEAASQATGRARGRPRRSSSTQSPGASSPRVEPVSGKGRGMPQGNASGLARWKRPVQEENSSGGQTRPFKRTRMVGIGIYQAEDGFTTLNPGLPSRRVINTGARMTKRADVVTGDIGHTPKHGFKWKGKTTVTSRNLERVGAEKIIQTRSTAAANNQSQTSSTKKTHVPWK